VRYLKVTVLLGLLAAAIIMILMADGAFRALDLRLCRLSGMEDIATSGGLLQHGLVLLLALGIAWTTVDIPRVSLKVIVACMTLVEVFAVSWIAQLYGHFFSPFPGAAAVVLAAAAGLFYAQTEGGRRKRVLRLILGDRLSRESFYSMVNSRQPVRLSGESCEATIVVCGIMNREELLEKLPVNDCVTMINRLLTEAGDFLVEAGGYLDEMGSESLRVIFGAPLKEEKHAAKACAAALGLAEKLDALNREFAEAKGHKLDWRIGVNSGEMVAAAYGSKRLVGFSVSGETVDFAGRLCTANAIFGSRILVGGGAFSEAGEEIEVRPVEIIRNRATNDHEEVYELLGMKGRFPEEAAKRRDAFWKGVVYFREKRWDAAQEQFASARAGQDEDALIAYYQRRIEESRHGVATDTETTNV
jgi:adenylate cyclase